jgi:hypothetical protein
MIFYKRSTPAPVAPPPVRRKPAVAAGHKSRENKLLDLQLVEARRQADQASRLSSFERELLQAWSQDH